MASLRKTLGLRADCIDGRYDSPKDFEHQMAYNWTVVSHQTWRESLSVDNKEAVLIQYVIHSSNAHFSFDCGPIHHLLSAEWFHPILLTLRVAISHCSRT